MRYHHVWSELRCSLLTSSSLRGCHLLHCLHSSRGGHHDDLLTPRRPDDLLAGPCCQDLLRTPARLVDDDGLLPTDCRHLHAGLDLAAHHVRPDGSDLGCSSGRFVDN